MTSVVNTYASWEGRIHRRGLSNFSKLADNQTAVCVRHLVQLRSPCWWVVLTREMPSLHPINLGRSRSVSTAFRHHPKTACALMTRPHDALRSRQAMEWLSSLDHIFGRHIRRPQAGKLPFPASVVAATRAIPCMLGSSAAQSASAARDATQASPVIPPKVVNPRPSLQSIARQGVPHDWPGPQSQFPGNLHPRRLWML